jgi:hypothetical protein
MSEGSITIWQCDVCKYITNSFSGMETHMTSEHVHTLRLKKEQVVELLEQHTKESDKT